MNSHLVWKNCLKSIKGTVFSRNLPSLGLGDDSVICPSRNHDMRHCRKFEMYLNFESLPNNPAFYSTTQCQMEKKLFENNVVKGENAGIQHFLLFPECFLSYQRKIASFVLH